MKYFEKQILFLIIILLWPNFSYTQVKKNKLGIIFGQWQPNLLKSEKPISVFTGTANSSPYFALNYDRVLFGNIGAHFSVGYWNHLFERADHDETLSILPLEFGIEHQLIDNFVLSPYVLYGAGFLLGRSEKKDKLKNFSLDHFTTTGIGFFLLTGLRFLPLETIELDLNFGYLYARFPIKVGSGEDYSGVRATLGINYVF